MTPLDMLRVALFGCYSSSIFSEGVMSPVLDLDKSKASGANASLMAKYNDRPGKERCSSATFKVYFISPLCKHNKSTYQIIAQLSGTSCKPRLIRRSVKETGRDLVKSFIIVFIPGSYFAPSKVISYTVMNCMYFNSVYIPHSGWTHGANLYIVHGRRSDSTWRK